MVHFFITKFASQGNLKVPNVRTTSYGKSSFTSMAVKTWNDLQKQLKENAFNAFTPNKPKAVLQGYFINLNTFSQ